MRMMINVLLIMLGLALVGCDSKQGSGNDALDEIMETSEQKQTEMLEQLDSGEGLDVDTGYVGDMADKFDEAAEEMNDADAAIVRGQAQTLREIQTLMKPYEDTLNAFLSLGGLDVTTIASVESIDQRIGYLQELALINEDIAVGIPELLKKLGDDPVTLAKKLGLIEQIRQTDRELFPSMISYLQIIGDEWGEIQIQDDGNFLFGADTSDEMIQEFNRQSQLINEISATQIELQRALVLLDE